MSSRRLSEDQQIYRDRLLAAGETLRAMETFDSMAQRQVQNAQTERRLKLDEAQNERASREEMRNLTNQEKRLGISEGLSEFVAVFDATNVEHQKGLAAWETKARTNGFDDREVETILLPAKRSLVALNDQLAALRAQSGIQDWERTVDPVTGAERIDVSETLRKHSGMLKDIAQIQSSWEPGGREEQLVDYWTKTDPSISKAQAIRAANKNQRVGSEYASLIEEGLFAPSQDFLNDFRRQPTKPGVTLAEESIGFVPTMFNTEMFDTHPGALKARAALRRVQNGELPVFKKDPVKGTVMYDDNGAAIIESWQPSYDTRKKAAETTKAEADAAGEAMLNEPTRKLDPITGLPMGTGAGPSLRQQAAQADLDLKRTRQKVAERQLREGVPVTALPTDGD